MRGTFKRVGRRLTTSDDGYTLVEMLVVIGIIAVIAAVLTPSLLGSMQRARSKTAQMQVQTVAAALEAFRADVGRYPSQSESLTVLVGAPDSIDGWTGPYLKNAKYLQDPWGRNLEYSIDNSGQQFTVRSLGSDGVAGGNGTGRDLISSE